MKTIRFLMVVIVFGYAIARADAVLVPDFRVDQDPTPNGISAVASSLNYNYFVVAWRYANPPTYKGDTYARRFDLNGNPLGNAFRVDSAPDGIDAVIAGVIIDTNGNMVFGFGDSRTGSGHVYFRRFDINETPLNSDTMVDQGPVALGGEVASLPGGGFVIAYYDGRGVGGSIYARIYDSGGNPIGNDFRVDQNPDIDSNHGISEDPCVATNSSGQIYFAWEDRRNTGLLFGGDIYARLFDSTGTPLGNDFQVDQAPDIADYPTIGVALDGNFIVSWDDLREEGAFGQPDVFARAFDPTGTPFSGDFKVNSETTGESANSPYVAFAPSGRAFIVWNDSRGGVYGRHLDSAGNFLDNDFRVDGGDLCGYSRATPAGTNTFLAVWDDCRTGNLEEWANITGPFSGSVPVLSPTVIVILAFILLLILFLFIRKRSFSYLFLLFIFSVLLLLPITALTQQCPPMSTSGLSANRVEPILAGITTSDMARW
jgi:hypothetical protein